MSHVRLRSPVVVVVVSVAIVVMVVVAVVVVVGDLVDIEFTLIYGVRKQVF